MAAIKDDYYHVGLTDEQVRKSREEHGVNLLTPPKPPSLWKLYLAFLHRLMRQLRYRQCR